MFKRRFLRNWDIGKKELGLRCLFFVNYQCYDVFQEEIDFNNKVFGIRLRLFYGYFFYSDFYELDVEDDFDFVSKFCG